MKPPLCLQQGSLLNWVGVFHTEADDDESSKILTWRGAYLFHICMFLLPWPSLVSSHGSHPVHYVMASMGQDIYPFAKHTWSCRHPCPLHITWSFHPSSVDAPVDIHGRRYSFPLIYPREVFLAWCWVITRPSTACGIVSLSLPLGVGLTGMGLVHLSHTWCTPTHKGMPASDTIRRSQSWCRMCEFPMWFSTSNKGMSVMIWCTTSWGLSSHLFSIFLLPWKAFTLIWTRSQTSNLWYLFSSHSNISVCNPQP